MRCGVFVDRRAAHAVPPELLYTELNGGKVADDDYQGRSAKYMKDVVAEPPQGLSSNDALHLWQLNDVLSLEYSGMEHGLVRMSNGVWYLAGKTALRNCTGDMIDWWFSHCDSTERIRWSHPLDNIEGEYDPSFYATQPEDSITACIIGKIYMFHSDFGDVQCGHVCHMVKEKGLGQNELVSRMWLGEVKKEEAGFPPASLVNAFANGYMYRCISMPYSWAFDQWTHMLQEMGCVVNFLDKFYHEELARLSGKSMGEQTGAEELDFDEESMPSTSQPDHVRRASGDSTSKVLNTGCESSAGGDSGSRGANSTVSNGLQVGVVRGSRKSSGRRTSFDTPNASLDPPRASKGAQEKPQHQDVDFKSLPRKSDKRIQYSDKRFDLTAEDVRCEEDVDRDDDNSQGGEHLDDSTMVSASTASTSRKIGRGVGI